jgi:uncharacterized membrane protein
MSQLLTRRSKMHSFSGYVSQWASAASALLAGATHPRRLAFQFFFQCSVAVLILALLVPPFENPDEFNHANRVDQISQGGLIATRFNGKRTSGGVVDTGINRIDAIIGPIRFHPERKVTRAMMLEARAIRWGARAPTTFANTSIYAPFLYMPAVVGVWLGKTLGLSITRSFVVARAISGLVCVLLASMAIAFADEAAVFLFIVLSLPMSVFLFASVSQDGPMLAMAAGAIALLSVLQKRPERAGCFCLIALCICLAALGIGRPAYATFCVVPLLLPRTGLRQRIVASAVSLCAVAVWSLVAAHWTMINAEAFRAVDPKAQIFALIRHPATVWTLATSVVTGAQGMEGSSFFREMVGILGWQDVILPDFFYGIAGCVLAGATVVSLARSTNLLPWWAMGVAALAGAGAIFLIFLLEYVSWTPVGFPIVQGVQGRYFLPVLLFLPAMLPALRNAIYRRVCAPITVVLLIFPLVSVAVTVAAVVHRYYL